MSTRTRSGRALWTSVALMSLTSLDRALADPVVDAETTAALEHAAAQALRAWSRVSEDELSVAIFADASVRRGAVRALCGGLEPPDGEIAESRVWDLEESRDVAQVLIESAAQEIVRAENELRQRKRKSRA